jgi:hypothetical protein
MDESIAKYYFDELQKASNPVQTLVNFYMALFETSVSTNTYKIFGRLVKIYGWKIIYFSLLDCSMVDSLDLTSIHRLIHYFAKKYIAADNKNLPDDLNDLAEKNMKTLTKERRLKIPDIF